MVMENREKFMDKKVLETWIKRQPQNEPCSHVLLELGESYILLL